MIITGWEEKVPDIPPTTAVETCRRPWSSQSRRRGPKQCGGCMNLCYGSYTGDTPEIQ
jgi:hypothetical protein